MAGCQGDVQIQKDQLQEPAKGNLFGFLVLATAVGGGIYLYRRKKGGK